MPQQTAAGPVVNKQFLKQGDFAIQPPLDLPLQVVAVSQYQPCLWWQLQFNVNSPKLLGVSPNSFIGHGFTGGGRCPGDRSVFQAPCPTLRSWWPQRHVHYHNIDNGIRYWLDHWKIVCWAVFVCYYKMQQICLNCYKRFQWRWTLVFAVDCHASLLL